MKILRLKTISIQTRPALQNEIDSPSRSARKRKPTARLLESEAQKAAGDTDEAAAAATYGSTPKAPPHGACIELSSEPAKRTDDASQVSAY